MNAWYLLFGVGGGLWLVGFAWFIHSVRHAPFGFEDRRGFHFDRSETDSRRTFPAALKVERDQLDSELVAAERKEYAS